MNFSTANITKSTPRLPRAIGNAVIFICLGLQPLISAADDKDMSHKAKFWAGIVITILGTGTKGFTMMLSNDDPEKPKDDPKP